MDASELSHLIFRTSVDRAQLQLMVLSAKLTPEQPMPAAVKHWDVLAGFVHEHEETNSKIHAQISKLAQDSGHADAAAMATASTCRCRRAEGPCADGRVPCRDEGWVAAVGSGSLHVGTLGPDVR